MPKMDKTGPQGAGPQTGRGMGQCGGGLGLGGGRCFGMGRGRRRFMAMSKDERKKLLEEEATYLKEDLEDIEMELKNIEE